MYNNNIVSESHPEIVIGALSALVSLCVVILYELNNRVLTTGIRAILLVALCLFFVIALKITLVVSMVVLMGWLFANDAPDGKVRFVEDEDD